MLQKPHPALCLARLVFFLLLGACPVFGAGWKQLHGHVPEITKKLTATGRLAATNELHLAIGVPLRDAAGLDKFIADVYDPASSNYRRFLTPEEFTTRFSATAADYAAVKNFALTNGFKIAGEYDGRMLLAVTAQAADVERAFHFKLNRFKHPSEAREFFAPDVEPTVDAALPVVDIQGLSDFSRPHPRLHKQDLKTVAPLNGSAPDTAHSYLGDDFRNAYAPGTPLTGAGQQVGLLQFDGYYASDIAAYATLAGGGRSSIVIQTVLTDSYNGTPTTGANSGNGEVSLDIEMAMAMAPGLAKIVVFEANPTGGNANTIFAAMVTNTAIKQFSSSWGWSGGVNTTTENYFKQMASQGQSFFNASGDSDAFLSGQVDDPTQTTYPSGSPNITQVGGTTLTMNGTGVSYASETAWNWGYDSNVGGYVGSSGGISSNAIPAWQQGISMAANGGSTTGRNVPDVALTADSCYVLYGNGSNGSFGGTSCAAPLWAGFMALVNQQAAGFGNPSAGFINPAIYDIGKGLNTNYSYAACFHDATVGDNFWPSSPTSFPAVAGYDLCTGWGTPTGTNLIYALGGSPDGLEVTPYSGFSVSGLVGGPFIGGSQVFFLTNTSAASMNWSLINTSVWLTVVSSSGSLGNSMGTNVTVSLNPSVSNLAAGTYSAVIQFSNQTTHVAQLRTFSLQIRQTLVQNGDFETGDFTAWTLSGKSSLFTVSSSPTYVHSGTYGLQAPASSLGYITENLPTVPGQSYQLSFWFFVSSTRSGQQFQVNWNGATVYSTSSPPTSWTNQKLIVTATTANTQLQFGLNSVRTTRSFGLDDISVTPVNPPAIIQQPVSQTNFIGSNVVFTAAATGTAPLSYQWQTNGVNITDGAGVSGAMTNVLTLTAITTNSAANYSLVVTNAYGSITSSVATLTVNLIPPGIGSVAANLDGSFSLNLTGSPGHIYVLEAATNLFPSGSWLPIATNTLGTNGDWPFTDPSATNFQRQFYRLRLAQ